MREQNGSIKVFVQVYCVSFPTVLICLFGAFYIMLWSFWVEEMLVEMQHRDGSQIASLLVFLPSIVYAVLVYIMNLYYRKLASFLTEWGMKLDQ
jgi:anoctamin-10